jgi:3-phenylpropionate/trans-cinnamate dioxygenase ferredoxin reductase subunit
MSATPTHVIIGAGLAGAAAAEALRAEGFDGRIVLLGAEAHRPYERPPLSKELLRGESSPEQALVHGPQFYEDHAIELRLGRRATRLDLVEHTVHLDDGEPLAFQRLLLTTGARPRQLRLPGAGVERIHLLRDLDDVRAIRGALGPTSRVVVVGTGWIGTEVAASLRQLGHEVALVGPSPLPLPLLGPDVGAVYRDLHAEHGVALHLGRRVDGFVGDPHVTGVVLRDGPVLEADLVVVGVGAVPRVELAEAAGLTVDQGVVVDEHLESSAPGVFAAGDVASAWHPVLERRLRVEHWDNARHQGATAARNMLGADESYTRIPSFFSDQYDLGMEYVGHADPDDRVVFRGNPATRTFLAFWLRDDRVTAAMHANVWDATDHLRALVESRGPVDAGVLADADTPLEDVVQRTSTVPVIPTDS